MSEPDGGREEAPRQNFQRYLDDRDEASLRRSRFQSHGRNYFQKKPQPDAEMIVENGAVFDVSQRRTKKALENIVDLIENKLCRFDPQAIEEAIDALERRVLETERKTWKP